MANSVWTISETSVALSILAHFMSTILATIMRRKNFWCWMVGELWRKIQFRVALDPNWPQFCHKKTCLSRCWMVGEPRRKIQFRAAAGWAEAAASPSNSTYLRQPQFTSNLNSLQTSIHFKPQFTSNIIHFKPQITSNDFKPQMTSNLKSLQTSNHFKPEIQYLLLKYLPAQFFLWQGCEISRITWIYQHKKVAKKGMKFRFLFRGWMLGFSICSVHSKSHNFG